MLLDRIIFRIRNRKKNQLDYENELVTDSDFEKYLLDEIIFLDQDFEEKLDQEIRNEEAKLKENIILISKLVQEYDLFDQGKHIDEAVAIILEKRIQIIYSINEDFMLEYDIMDNRNYEKVLSKLETVPIFLNLREKEKQGVKRKINALIQTRLWSISEIVEFTKQIIKNTINSEDTDNEYKRTSNYKNQSLDENFKFFSGFTNLLISKTLLKETTI